MSIDRKWKEYGAGLSRERFRRLYQESDDFKKQIPLSETKIEKILFVPDTHIPYEDKRAWNLMLKSASEFKPDRIVILGDFADCFAISSHSRNPNRERLFDREVSAVRVRRKELDDLGASEKNFVEGNHCNRLDRYLSDKAPELYNLVGIQELFQLKENGWTFTPYKQSLRIGKLNVTHDVGSAGPTAHMKAQQAFEGNVVIGHVHRISIHYAGNIQGKTHVGATFGWLGDSSKVDYLHQAYANRNWNLGFGIGYMLPNGVVHLHAVPLIDYKTIIEGKLIHG